MMLEKRRKRDPKILLSRIKCRSASVVRNTQDNYFIQFANFVATFALTGSLGDV